MLKGLFKGYLFVLVSILLGCDSQSTTDTKDVISDSLDIENAEEINVVPNIDTYVDESIVDDVDLEYQGSGEEKELLVCTEDGKCELLKYEGTLMKASNVNGMFLLHFIPFSYWDENLETEIQSLYDFDLELMLTKDQNAVLGYVDFSEATNNLAWDYFENLFTIYYYQDVDGQRVPLKFINQGKTEWDG